MVKDADRTKITNKNTMVTLAVNKQWRRMADTCLKTSAAFKLLFIMTVYINY